MDLSSMDKVVRDIRTTRGLSVKVAEVCKISRAAVYQWRQVPPRWVHHVAHVTGLKPEQIRPDIFKTPYGGTHGKVGKTGRQRRTTR